MELLKKLCNTPAPSGDEGKVRNLIMDETSEFGNAVTDSFGNILIRNSEEPISILFECGMDEPSIMSVGADKNGCIKFSTPLGLKPLNIINSPVLFENAKGIIRCDAPLTEKMPLSELYIDIGADNKEDAENSVGIGEFAVFASNTQYDNDFISANNLSYKIPVYLMINLIKKLNTDKNIAFLFSSQKCLSARGIIAALPQLSPETVITLNTFDSKEKNTPEILVKDKHAVSHDSIRNIIENIAKQENQDYGFYLGNEDFSLKQIQNSSRGSKCGGLLIPIKYKNLPYETVSIKNLKKTENLLLKIVEHLCYNK